MFSFSISLFGRAGTAPPTDVVPVQFRGGVLCGLSLLLILILALRVILWVLRFSSLHENTPNSNATRIEDPHENQLRLMWLPL